MTSDHFLPVRLIVGLGNPGEEYAGTYHNIGVLALEYLLDQKPDVASPTTRQNFKYWKLGEEILVKPLVFMNESGQAVRDALSFFKIHPEKLLVVHDDSDLPVGGYKLSFGRGSAGHRGVQSIIEALGTKTFWRLRIGSRSGTGKAGDLVLRPIKEDDRKLIQSVFSGTILKLTEKVNP